MSEERADGSRRQRFVEARRLVAGEEIYYTIRVRNPGKEPVTDIVVTKRMPFGVAYVTGSAAGPACDVEFSDDNGATYCAGRQSPANSRTSAGFSSIRSLPVRPRCCAFAPRSADRGTDLAEIFAADGPLARALPGYSGASAAVGDGRARRRRAAGAHADLVVEAGTGTGKTFAYLVPALLSGRKVIVSTGTRALQDQLFHRDLPTSARALGRPVRIALLKGRANYLCRHRLDIAEQQAYCARVGARKSRPRCRRSVRGRTRRSAGDIAELPGLGEQDPVWPWVTSTRENCLGAECPKFDDCFVLAARREAQAADIVVVNHYLLMADLVLKEEGFGDLLPGADAIVIDEAHQLPDVAAQFLGYSVSTRQLPAITEGRCRRAAARAADGAPASTRALTGLDAQVAAVLASAGSGTDARLEHSQWPDRLLESLNGLAGRATELAEALAPLGGRGAGRRSQRLRERLEESAERLNSLTARGSSRVACAGRRRARAA